MANPNRQEKPDIELSEQRALNRSFDREFDVLAVETLGYNGSALTRTPTPFIDVAFDYIGFSNADANGNYQTWTFKRGGSAGTTVRTLTVAYDANSKITSIERS